MECGDGARLWTESGVDPGAPAAVLVHGGPGMWDYLGPVARLLPGISTLRYDQRGCGRSGADPDLRMERYVADLEELREFAGVERWAVFGHSFGARLALAYAARHPGRVVGVVHCSGVGLDWPVHRAEYRRRSRARLTEEQAAELLALDGRVRTWDEEVRWRTLNWLPDFVDPAARELHDEANTRLPVNLEANRVLNAETERSGADERAECSAVRCPVLVVHGSEDPRPLDGVRELVAALPSAELHVVDGAGHQPWVERPTEFAAAVGAFLTR